MQDESAGLILPSADIGYSHSDPGQRLPSGCWNMLSSFLALDAVRRHLFFVADPNDHRYGKHVQIGTSEIIYNSSLARCLFFEYFKSLKLCPVDVIAAGLLSNADTGRWTTSTSFYCVSFSLSFA